MPVPPGDLVPPSRLVEVKDWPAFLGLAQEWNELVESRDDQPFYRHEFIRIWIEHFAPAARLRVMTLRNEGGRLVAVLPLMERRAVMYGVPVRQLEAIANEHSCRFDFIADDEAGAGRRILSHLAGDPSLGRPAHQGRRGGRSRPACV
jgi:hypothetical protein